MTAATILARDEAALGDLPVWDLTDLYASPDAPELARDLDWLDRRAAAFAADYEGKLATLDAPGLLDAVRRYERSDIVAAGSSYAGLRYYQNTTDRERAKFFGDCRPRSPPPRPRWSSSPSSSTASTTPRSTPPSRRPGARPLQAGLRPHPQDEALPALRRARALPARPVGRRRLRLEPALRRDHRRPRLRGRRRDADRSRPPSTSSPTRTAPGARPAPRRSPRSSPANLRSSRASPTRSPRRRRSRTAGASCRPRRPAATSPTTSSPRWSRRCATPSSPPIRGSRTATTR